MVFRLFQFILCLCVVTAIQSAKDSNQEFQLVSRNEIEAALKKCPDLVNQFGPNFNLMSSSTESNGGRVLQLQAKKMINPVKFRVYGKRVVSVLSSMNSVWSKFKLDSKLKDWSEQLRSASTSLNERLARLGPVTDGTDNALRMVSAFDMSATVLLQSIGTMALYLGPIGDSIGLVVTISALMNNAPSVPRIVINALQVALDDINRRFDIIEDKIDNVEFVVEKVSAFSAYKSIRDQIHDVMHKFQALGRSMNRVSLQEFQEICEINDPHLALAWIHRHVVHEEVGVELVSSVLRGVQYDRDKLRVWVSMIIKDALEAVFLREACIGARLGKTSTAQSTGDYNGTVDNSELLCAIGYGRSEADIMVKEITKKLDEAELALMEDFDSAYLPRDLKMISQQTSKLCSLPTKTEQFLRSKYNWLNWWVAVTKQKLTIFSVDGHFTQVPIMFGKTKYYLVAIGSELNTLIPNLDRVNWNTNDRPNYWQVNQTSYIDPDSGFDDNILQIISNMDDYPCPFKYPHFGFAKDKQGRRRSFMKMEHEIQKRWIWDNTEEEKRRNFFIYFKSRALPSSLGCRATSRKLNELGVKRRDYCSANAFKRLVTNMIHHFATSYYGENLEMELHNELLIRYSELDWSIHIVSPNSTFLSNCDISPNCELYMGTEDSNSTSIFPMLIIWKPKCNLTSYTNAAKKVFHMAKSIQNELFANADDTMETVMQFIQDPFQFANNMNIINKFEDVQILKKLSYMDKIVLLTEHKEKSGNKFVLNEDEDRVEDVFQINTAHGKYVKVNVLVEFYVSYDDMSKCQWP